jgi:hypothetical protein
MIVVQTYTKDAEQFAGLTFALDFEDCKKRLRLYFKNVGEVKARLYAGEVVSLPYITLQKDRRFREIKVSNERRLK